MAVLAVMVYHFGQGWLPGGYIGVDVFFVLSGYLITTLLVQNLPEPVRARTFWERRARRLFPALAVMLAGGLRLCLDRAGAGTGGSSADRASRRFFTSTIGGCCTPAPSTSTLTSSSTLAAHLDAECGGAVDLLFPRRRSCCSSPCVGSGGAGCSRWLPCCVRRRCSGPRGWLVTAPRSTGCISYRQPGPSNSFWACCSGGSWVCARSQRVERGSGTCRPWR